MEAACTERIGQLLSAFGIGNGEKGVIGHLEGDARLQELAGQPGVAVKVDL